MRLANRMRVMTPEEADKAYDEAPAIPITDAEITRMVNIAIGLACPNCGEEAPGGLFVHLCGDCEICKGELAVTHCGCFHG